MQTIISKLPRSMPSFDRVKIIAQLEEELGPIHLNLSSVAWHQILIDQKQVDNYINELSVKLNFSFENFLCPPVRHCILCQKELTKNHAASQVVVCTSEGLKSGSSYSYRCRTCKYVYQYDTYGYGDHRYYYDVERDYIRASQIMFIERKLMDHWQQLSLHSQVSFESFAICYNATFKNVSTNVGKRYF